MEMEVVVPLRGIDLDMSSSKARCWPYSSAPSTPKRSAQPHLSAVTSPTQPSALYGDGRIKSRATPAVPFEWEEKPGTPKSCKRDDEFAFDVSSEWESTAPVSAAELFDGGKIKPLKESASWERERGRVVSGSGHRKGAKSVSELRVGEFPFEEEKELLQRREQSSSAVPTRRRLSSSTSSITSSSSWKLGSRKWKLKDLFLFRSASEGRAADRDPLRKYTTPFKKQQDVKKESIGSWEGSMRRRGPISPHELHYTVNRAVSEDMKKKTFLPYKQGILGRLAFNPALHALANGFGLSRK